MVKYNEWVHTAHFSQRCTMQMQKCTTAFLVFVNECYFRVEVGNLSDHLNKIDNGLLLFKNIQTSSSACFFCISIIFSFSYPEIREWNSIIAYPHIRGQYRARDSSVAEDLSVMPGGLQPLVFIDGVEKSFKISGFNGMESRVGFDPTVNVGKE